MSMLIAYDEIVAAIAAELQSRGIGPAKPRLMPIEPPRDWGLTTNVCFGLGQVVAAGEIALKTAGLAKKEAKHLTAELSRHGGEWLAEHLAEALAAKAGTPELPFIARVEAEGAYVNFYYEPSSLAAHVLAEILKPDAEYGRGADTGRRVMVEFAQPNTHKDLHVGHLRNAAIGQAIANLVEYSGHTVLKATYLGDVGAHVAKAMVGAGFATKDEIRGLGFYQDLPDPEQDALAYWGAVYRETTRYIAWLDENRGDEAAITKARLGGWLKRWEMGNETARNQWQESRDACIAEFKSIFDELMLEIDDDCWFYESTVDDTHLGQQAAEELKIRGIAVVDESPEYKDALYVDFAEQAASFSPEEQKRIRKLGKMTILRSDGTSLYQTKELGLAKYKFDTFNLDESLYVVGSEQKLYFEQVLAILRLWGFPNAENCRHIAYELVVLPEGKMSSREGEIVSYRELRDRAIERAAEITAEKGIAGDVAGTAREIAIAAIKFAMLAVTGSQQIVFDFDQALSFSGRAAPYLQYAYARTRKLAAGLDPAAVATTPGHGLHASETFLVRLLSDFPRTCALAAEKHEPAIVCNYLFELASAFSDFYRDCRVLDAPEAERGFRQALVLAFRRVMSLGFGLLAMPLPEEM